MSEANSGWDAGRLNVQKVDKARTALESQSDEPLVIEYLDGAF